MIMLAVMMFVYAICCFGEMRKLALLYLIMTVINFTVYPLFDALDPERNASLVRIMYMYGSTEELLKLIIAVALTKLKYKWLLFLLVCHIINHAFNSFYYEVVNNAIIVCEMSLFIWLSRGSLVRFFENIFARNLRLTSFNRSIS